MKTTEIRPEQAEAEFVRLLKQEHRRFLDERGRLRPEVTVHVDCPLCGSDDRRAYDPEVEPAYQLCARCGCVYADPRLSDEVMNDFVRNSPALSFFQEHILLATEPVRRDQVFRPRLELLRREVPSGRVLELGSGVGTFMGLLRQAGYDAEGIELCRFSLTHSRDQGYRVYDCPIERLDLPANRYNAVCAWGVFDHVASPRDTVAAVFRVLAPGGLLALATTNCVSFEHLILKARHPVKNPLVFYQFYPPEATRQLLASAGFVDIRITTPGRTDVQTVRNVFGKPDPALGSFLNHILFDESAQGDENREALQRFVADRQLSGHMLVTARKPA